MIDEIKEPVPEEGSTTSEALKPKPPAHLAPQGIRTFTVCRRSDETGISGDGIVIEGIELATGQAVVHWLWPRPRGSIAIFDSFSDFVKVHIQPHPKNGTIITFEDGEQQFFGMPAPVTGDEADAEE
ncbi:hypothetical protein HN588_05060 [Candidatus Bathyarchaeota archaeon]|jgi:hypothetical protein|nr:hypothetical protein [Candidatus Bathyarchaeota archaeon]|tara:strand:- start:579 stop:959 length:381 start_codon:yes stop_codon:yes gene_type:complete